MWEIAAWAWHNARVAIGGVTVWLVLFMTCWLSKSWWGADEKNVGLHPVVPKIFRSLVATGETAAPRPPKIVKILLLMADGVLILLLPCR
ncbi:MAG: hypothetical protein EAS52_05160 [Parapedobacter sp.]|nr:MAG: hypothetical protein EAS52_05160 [Parapedobacter sp.]